MPRCFVIQPFSESFDKRYRDTFAPAIEAAGLSPYRVDQDPSVHVLIDTIEQEIARSDAALADITIDNPNVWFELGYAIACQKDVIIVCSAERPTPFPFDIQHHRIIRYKTESASDWDRLKEDIAQSLRARIASRSQVKHLLEAQPTIQNPSLKEHEVNLLITLSRGLLTAEPVSPNEIASEMGRLGFPVELAGLGIHSLKIKEYVRSERVSDYNEAYTGYALTDAGISWLDDNLDFSSYQKAAPKHPTPEVQYLKSSTSTDDLPF